MARILTSDQKALLASPACKVNLFAVFYLDEGTYRFCSDVIDLSDGTDTYLGASALLESTDVMSSDDMAAESITLTCDGNRMAEYGVADPAKVLREMQDYLFQQRRVDFMLGFRWPSEHNVSLMIPAHAGKINNTKLTDPEIDFETHQLAQAKLDIVIDALALRYQRATNRTRSNDDQLQIDPTDKFYSFTQDATYNERTLYWGRKTPSGISNRATTYYSLSGPISD